jgi:hypothetical protein
VTRDDLKKLEGHVDTVLGAWVLLIWPATVIGCIWGVLDVRWFWTAFVILVVLLFYSIAVGVTARKTGG